MSISSPIIEVDDLRRTYPALQKSGERVAVVDGVSFSIARGEVFGIFGPDGAGKTTTLEIIAGIAVWTVLGLILAVYLFRWSDATDA